MAFTKNYQSRLRFRFWSQQKSLGKRILTCLDFLDIFKTLWLSVLWCYYQRALHLLIIPNVTTWTGQKNLDFLRKYQKGQTDMTRHDMTWHDMTWQDMTRHDMTDMTWPTWHDMTDMTRIAQHFQIIATLAWSCLALNLMRKHQ